MTTLAQRPVIAAVPAGFAFDEARHEYRLDGRLVEGVTGVLQTLHSFANVPALILEAAQERGTNAHLACQYWDEDGAVEAASLTADTAARLDWWREFLADYKPEFVGIERPVYHRALRFAGTCDRFAIIGGRPWVIDIKTALEQHPVWGMQTAAYAQAAGVDWCNAKRATVQILRDRYLFREWADPTDWPAFASLLTTQRWCKKQGI